MLVLDGHTKSVRSVAYSPCGTRLASGGEDGRVNLWSLATGLVEKRFSTDSAGVESVAWAPDGKIVTAGCADGRIQSWHREGMKYSLQRDDPRGIRTVAYLDQESLVSANWNGSATLWYPAHGKDCAPLRLPRSRIHSIACAVETQMLALGDLSGTVSIQKRKSLAHKVVGNTAGCVYALAFSPPGDMLAGGDALGQVTLFDIAKRKVVGRLKGHGRVVYGLAFSPDGSRLISGGADATVRLWDVAERRECGAFHWDQGWLTSLAFAPDGLTAAAGTGRHTVVVWDIDAWGA